MKKIIWAILCIVCFTFITGQVLADSNSIEIIFKEGSDIYKINGKDITLAKSFSKSNILFVPTKVLTDAFNAQIQINDKDKSILIQYKDTTIKLALDSKDAYIDGKKITMAEAPKNISGTIMIPIKFIVENLGAELKYDDKLKQYTVIKEIVSDNSIKDYALILKKTTKERIGDSYHGWSIALPKSMKITYRNFNGNYNSFEAYDKTYWLYMSIRNMENQTLDSLMAQKIDDIQDYTLIDQAKTTVNGQEYVKVSYKDSEGTYEDRLFIKGNKIYELDLETDKYDTYIGNKEIAAMMDSFRLEFIKNEKTEDLSDVNVGGYRPYESKKLKWSVNVPASWTEDMSINKENIVSFMENTKDTGLYANFFNVQMYSIESGLTLESWFQDELTQIKEGYNPEKVKILGTEDVTINNIKAKQIFTNIKLKDKSIYTCDTYIMGKNYRYVVSYTLKGENYDSMKASVLYMIKSFVFSEPDAKSIGPLVDPDKIIYGQGVRKIEDKEKKWSSEIPIRWTSVAPQKDSFVNACYRDLAGQMSITITAAKDGTLDEYVKIFDDMSTRTTGNDPYFSFKKTNFQDKGTMVKQYDIAQSSGDTIVNQKVFLLYKNGFIYMVTLNISDLTKNEKNEKTLNAIWQSFKFE